MLPHFTLPSTEFSLQKTEGALLMDFSCVADDKPKELQRSLPKVTETGCHDACAHSSEAVETRSSTPEMPAVSAFFSLAALAEVAAMENVHRLVVGALFRQGTYLFTVTPCTERRWRKQRRRQKSAFLTSSVIFSQCIGVHKTWFKSTSVYVRLRKFVC